MEGIAENQGRDLSALEAVEVPDFEPVGEAAEEAGETEQEITLTETAKLKARAIVRGLEKVFRLKVPGFKYEDDVYQRAEEELAPVLDKYNIANTGPLKYAEEVDGALFMGGLLMESVGVVRQVKAEQQEQEQTVKNREYQPATRQAENGGQPGQFSTQ